MVQLSRRDERGAVAVMMALFLCFVFIILTALVVNLGHARDQRQASQNAADASALAAAGMLYASGSSTPDFAAANTAARLYAQKNFGITGAQWDACTDSGHFYVPNVTDKSPCISFTDNTLTTGTVTAPTKVRIRIPDTSVPDSLGAVAGGASSISVAAIARATIVPGVAAACSICIIGPGSHSLGNMDVTATTGDIYIDGTVALQPQGHITASSGTVNLQQGSLPSKGTVSSPNKVGQPAMSDPFANLAAPTFSTNSFLSTDTTHSNLCNGPGVYANPTASGCTTLPNGLYVIVAGTFSPAGLTTNAATFYFTCSDAVTPKKSATTYTPRACASGESGANWDLSGNGAATLHAPTAANVSGGDIAGMLFWYDRENTAGVILNGNPNLVISGTIYMANAAITYKGSGSVYNSQAQFVVGDLSGNGNPGTLQVSPTTNTEYTVAAGTASLDQ